MKRFFGIICLIFSCAIFLGSASIPDAYAQNIFVTPGGDGDDSGGNRNIYIPQRQTKSKPSPGAEKKGFDVFTGKSNKETKTKAERENERQDIFDKVQQRNIDLATERSAQNMQIIQQQREARIAQRQQERAVREEQAKKNAKNGEGGEVPPEMRQDEAHVQVGDQKVFIAKRKDHRKMDKPPRIFNAYD